MFKLCYAFCYLALPKKFNETCQEVYKRQESAVKGQHSQKNINENDAARVNANGNKVDKICEEIDEHQAIAGKAKKYSEKYHQK